MSCLEVDTLDPTIWTDACVATNFLNNETVYSNVKDTLKTCCGSNNLFSTKDDCYTYCNITTPYDTVMLTNCLFDTIDPSTSDDSVDFDCFPLAWEAASSINTSAGKIATTWTAVDGGDTEVVTEADGTVKTESWDYSESFPTGTAASPGSTAADATVTVKPASPGSTATIMIGTSKTTSPTTGSKTTSKAASPTSSKSSGGRGVRISYKAGVLVALSVLRLLL